MASGLGCNVSTLLLLRVANRGKAVVLVGGVDIAILSVNVAIFGGDIRILGVNIVILGVDIAILGVDIAILGVDIAILRRQKRKQKTRKMGGATGEKRGGG